MNLLYLTLLILFYLDHHPLKKWGGVFCSKAIAEGSVGCFKLYDDGKFTYESSGCLGREYYGSESFELGKDSIFFEYGEKQSVSKSKLDIIPLGRPSDGDSVSFNFEFFSLENEPMVLPGTNVMDVDPITQKNIKVYKSDGEGKITLKKKRGSNPVSLGYFFIGYELAHFTIVPNQDQRIIVYMAEYDGTEIFQRRIGYKINRGEILSFGSLPWGAYFKH